jgi:hypothetical protein
MRDLRHEMRHQGMLKRCGYVMYANVTVHSIPNFWAFVETNREVRADARIAFDFASGLLEGTRSVKGLAKVL